MKDNGTIAIIEFNTWHYEVIGSQVQFLVKSGYKVLMACDAKGRNIVDGYTDNSNVEVVYFDFSRFGQLLKFRNLLVARNIPKLIINTCSGSRAMKFCALFPPKSIEIYGVIHNIGKLTDSIGQKIICHRVKHFFVLAEYLTSNLPHNSHLQFSYFNPIYEPLIQTITIHKPQDMTWLVIPGTLETKRRDYWFLFDVIDSMKDSDALKHIQFIILGNSRTKEGIAFRQEVERRAYSNNFVFFDKFVDTATFDAYMRMADYLPMLAHPGHGMQDTYVGQRVSGTCIKAAIYTKMLICHKMFADIQKFRYASKFYSTIDEFVSIISTLQTMPVPNMLNFEADRKRYIEFISTNKS